MTDLALDPSVERGTSRLPARAPREDEPASDPAPSSAPHVETSGAFVSARPREAPSLEGVSERFGAALGLSSLLGFAAAPLLAHGSAIESGTVIVSGLGCLVAAATLHWRARRAAFRTLTDHARALGDDDAAAREKARATIRKWLS